MLKEMRMVSIFLLLQSMVIFTSCEKVIDLDLGDVKPMLVVEGNITNEAGPYKVRLTESVSFDQAGTYQGISDATVIISDDKGTIDTLNYTSEGYYITNKIAGNPGLTYTLVILHKDKSYKAVSTMPKAVRLEDVEQRNFIFGGENQISLIPKYTDLPELGNNYKFNLIKNETLINQLFLWNDNTNNGQLNQRPLLSNDLDLKSGDKVILELQTIDANAYTYYFTLAEISNDGPGGGTTPSNPPNNIKGGALGLFSAHCTERKEFIIR